MAALARRTVLVLALVLGSGIADANDDRAPSLGAVADPAVAAAQPRLALLLPLLWWPSGRR